MGPDAHYTFHVVCCILMITQNCVHGKPSKPILEIYSEDPNDVDMIGSMVYLNCTNSLNAQKFYLKKHGNSDIIKEQSSPEFTITYLSKSDSGLYTCQYSTKSELSELSDPMYLFVSDRYPPPTITAKPHSIVQPGEDVTIMCNSSYPNSIFTLFKGNTQIKENDNNPFIYVIHNANKEHAGQYSCRYRRLNIQSDFSSPLMIDVKALPRPFIAWEDNKEGNLRISCTAPENNKRMWFQLFNESKDVIDEIKAVKEIQVDFIVPYPEQSNSRYYCMYRIQVRSNFADSLISDAAVIREETRDYTMGNIIRLLLSTLIIILLTVIVVKHFKSNQECKSHPPELPAPRKKLATDSEYTQMEVMRMKNDDSPEKSSVQSPSTTEGYAVITKMEDMGMKNGDSPEKSSVQSPSTTEGYAVITKMEVNEMNNDEKSSVPVPLTTEVTAGIEKVEVLGMKNDDSLEKSSVANPQTVYAVIKTVNYQEELQTKL